MVEISTLEYIELLEYKLQCLELAKEEDSSWNYGIDELKLQIQELKQV